MELQKRRCDDVCECPYRFFIQAKVDIVLFPEGHEKNSNNLIEMKNIKGSALMMIEKTLGYLLTNVVKKQMLKP